MDAVAKDILESLDFIKEHMLTKDEGASKEDVRTIVREQTADLRISVAELTEDVASLKSDIADMSATMATSRELAAIHHELEQVREQLENVSGFRKEIDHALERIGAIERHVGLTR